MGMNINTSSPPAGNHRALRAIVGCVRLVRPDFATGSAPRQQASSLRLSFIFCSPTTLVGRRALGRHCMALTRQHTFVPPRPTEPR